SKTASISKSSIVEVVGITNNHIAIRLTIHPVKNLLSTSINSRTNNRISRELKADFLKFYSTLSSIIDRLLGNHRHYTNNICSLLNKQASIIGMHIQEAKGFLMEASILRINLISAKSNKSTIMF